MSEPPRSDPFAGFADHFAVATAVQRGVSPGRLRSGRTTAPFHGIRSLVADDGSLRARCHAYAPRLTPGQFFSHETALFLLGAPMPEWSYEPALHVATHRPAREPRTRGVVGHRLQIREPDPRRLADGLLVESPVRAWRQCGNLWRREDLVAAADHLVSGGAALASVADLRAEVQAMGDVRRGILSRALRDVRVGVRSARETRLRLRLVAGGLPEPVVAFELFDAHGTFVAEADLAYPRHRIAVEYDGRVHAEDARQFERDADRWEAIRRLGWRHVRILSHHFRGTGHAAVALVREALLDAGWTPGR